MLLEMVLNHSSLTESHPQGPSESRPRPMQGAESSDRTVLTASALSSQLFLFIKGLSNGQSTVWKSVCISSTDWLDRNQSSYPSCGDCWTGNHLCLGNKDKPIFKTEQLGNKSAPLPCMLGLLSVSASSLPTVTLHRLLTLGYNVPFCYFKHEELQKRLSSYQDLLSNPGVCLQLSEPHKPGRPPTALLPPLRDLMPVFDLCVFPHTCTQEIHRHAYK